MPKYLAAPGTPFNDEDAAEIGPELARLAEGGASTPEEIVDYARGAATPLRRHLHMDRPLEDVAESWYRQRARLAARSILVRVKVEDGYREVRAFHSVRLTVAGEEEGDEPRVEPRRYVTVQQVRRSPDMSTAVLNDALQRLEEWRERYSLYREVFTDARSDMADVFDAIEQVTSVPEPVLP